MRTAIYARISKDDEGESVNVKIQKDECRRYAEAQGWERTAAQSRRASVRWTPVEMQLDRGWLQRGLPGCEAEAVAASPVQVQVVSSGCKLLHLYHHRCRFEHPVTQTAHAATSSIVRARMGSDQLDPCTGRASLPAR